MEVDYFLKYEAEQNSYATYYGQTKSQHSTLVTRPRRAMDRARVFLTSYDKTCSCFADRGYPKQVMTQLVYYETVHSSRGLARVEHV